MQLTQTQLDDLVDRDLAGVDTVIIHHSVADKTLDISAISAMEIRSQSFVCVGYHAYVKCIDVAKDLWVVQQGRPIGKVPAAALGYNSRSYDICLGGNYEPGGAPFLDVVSPNALRAIVAQVNAAKAKLPNLKYLSGHRDVETWRDILAAENLTPADVATACPGDLLYARLWELRHATGLHTHP